MISQGWNNETKSLDQLKVLKVDQQNIRSQQNILICAGDQSTQLLKVYQIKHGLQKTLDLTDLWCPGCFADSFRYKNQFCGSKNVCKNCRRLGKCKVKLSDIS